MENVPIRITSHSCVPLPSLLQLLTCFLSLWIWIKWTYIQYVAFCVWFLSLNMIFLGFFHVVAWSHFMPFYHGYTTFIYSFIGWWVFWLFPPFGYSGQLLLWTLTFRYLFEQLLLEEVIERSWALVDLWAGPRQSEAPQSLPCPWNVCSSCLPQAKSCPKDTALR